MSKYRFGEVFKEINMKKAIGFAVIFSIFFVSYAAGQHDPNVSGLINIDNPYDVIQEPSFTGVNTEQAEEQTKESRTPDVIFVPTPLEVVDKMLELAQVKKDDLLYDLGCGDGRIVIAAAKKYGCKAVGYDIDPQRVKESRENVDANNVGDLVTIEQKDIFTLDLSKADVITLYLLPSLNVKLIPQLEKLKPGSRIVSHDFDMRGVKPDKVVTVTPEGGFVEHKVYLWTTPLKKELKYIREPDILFVPTPREVVDKMLELAQVKKGNLLYDLGCGDGRIVITAAKKYGCKAVGYDIDPNRVRESIKNVDANNVGDLVTIEQKDIFTLDLSKADVITLYLLPSLNVKLIPQLEKLKPGSRIVSHDFDMQGVKPDKVVKVFSKKDNRQHTVYLWTAPIKRVINKDEVADSLGLGTFEIELNDEEEQEEVSESHTPDVIYVPTPQEVVDKMLELVHVTKDDLVYDLGCGDGRIVITAAKKYGCKAVGYDIDPKRVKESRENVDANNVGDLVTIEQKDIFTLDLSKANVITLYLLPSLNVKLIPQLEKLKPGSRIVSHDFDMKGVKPDKVVKITPKDGFREHEIYFWTTPLKKEQNR
jgi:cyclopropane fatty-acyl-phospholipid synthase-like methyltransferase